jgi:hypothetical protein
MLDNRLNYLAGRVKRESAWTWDPLPWHRASRVWGTTSGGERTRRIGERGSATLTRRRSGWLSVRSGIIYGLWLSRQVRPLTLSNPTGPTRARAAVDSNGMTDCSGERRETKCIQC